MRLAVTLAVLLFVSTAGMTAPENLQDKKISVYASNLPVQNVLERLAKDAGVEILIDSTVRTPLDVSLSDVPVRTALNAICRAAGLQWQEVTPDSSGKPVFLVRQKQAESIVIDLPRPETQTRPVSTEDARQQEPQPAQQPAQPVAEETPRTVDADALLRLIRSSQQAQVDPYIDRSFQQPVRAPGLKIYPPAIHPTYVGGYPYIMPPPTQGTYILMPYPRYYYQPVGPVIRNPHFYSSFGAHYNSGGLSFQFSTTRSESR